MVGLLAYLRLKGGHLSPWAAVLMQFIKLLCCIMLQFEVTSMKLFCPSPSLPIDQQLPKASATHTHIHSLTHIQHILNLSKILSIQPLQFPPLHPSQVPKFIPLNLPFARGQPTSLPPSLPPSLPSPSISCLSLLCLVTVSSHSINQPGREPPGCSGRQQHRPSLVPSVPVSPPPFLPSCHQLLKK